MRDHSEALCTLNHDRDIDQLELPLLATCAEVLGPSDQQRWDRLLNASLRRAATNLDQARRLRDLLGRHQRYLIVLDGLDEAAVVETDAIGEFIDTHPGTVRVVITSRPGSWDPALLPLPDHDRHHKGTLEPFTGRDRDAAVTAWRMSDNAAARRPRGRPSRDDGPVAPNGPSCSAAARGRG